MPSRSTTSAIHNYPPSTSKRSPSMGTQSHSNGNTTIESMSDIHYTHHPTTITLSTAFPHSSTDTSHAYPRPPTTSTATTSSLSEGISPAAFGNICTTHTRDIELVRESRPPLDVAVTSQGNEVRRMAPQQCRSCRGKLSETGAQPSVHVCATYPAYFTAASKESRSVAPTDIGSGHPSCQHATCPPNYIDVPLKSGQVPHRGIAETVHPLGNGANPPLSVPTGVGEEIAERKNAACDPSYMCVESFSTTSVNHGVPLSSTHMQQSHQVNTHPPASTTHHYPLDSGSTTTQSHHGNRHVTKEPGYHFPHAMPAPCPVQSDASLLQGGRPQPVDETHSTSAATRAMSTGSQTKGQQWLSLPSATPERFSPLGGLKKEQRWTESKVCSRETGTQTMSVESVSTQTENRDERRSLTTPPLGMNIASDPPKRHIDSTIMSIGEFTHSQPTQTSKPDSPKHDTKVRAIGDTPGRPSLDEVLLEELMAHSVPASAQGPLSGKLVASQRSADTGATSKGRELSLE